MSLTNPTIIDKAVTAFKGWSLAVRIAVPLAALLIIIGAIFWGVSKFDTWRSNRDIAHAKQNVNAAMQNVNAARAVVANDAANEAAAVQQFKDAVNDAVTLSNASEAAKQETQKAAANYASAINENRPVATTEDDINKKLNALGDQ